MSILILGKLSGHSNQEKKWNLPKETPNRMFFLWWFLQDGSMSEVTPSSTTTCQAMAIDSYQNVISNSLEEKALETEMVYD